MPLIMHKLLPGLFSLGLFVALFYAVNAFQSQLYTSELTGYVKYWQTQTGEYKAPSSLQQQRIELAMKRIDQGLTPINPNALATMGRIHTWYARFASMGLLTADVDALLLQAENRYQQQAKQAPQWPYAHLALLETQAYKSDVSANLADLWQLNLNYAQQHAQINLAVAKLVPLLWPKLDLAQKKEGQALFLQAARASAQQAKQLFKQQPQQAELLLASCLVAKQQQQLTQVCRPIFQRYFPSALN